MFFFNLNRSLLWGMEWMLLVYVGLASGAYELLGLDVVKG